MAKISLGKVALTYAGTYASGTTYARYDFVTTTDSSYVSLQDNNKGHAVTETAWWARLADGSQATAAANAANTAKSNCETATANANTAKSNCETQTSACKTQTELAKELNEHPWQIDATTKHILTWDATADKYVDSGVLAEGGMMFPSIGRENNDLVITDQLGDPSVVFSQQNNDFVVTL